MQIRKIYKQFLSCSTITMDSRDVPPQSLFFALKGENFNGNRFAGEALSKGARYALVDEEQYARDDRFILVNDVLQTMQELATYHREQLKVQVIGITGTNGKTTTKALIKQILARTYNTIATEKNYNNHIGLPFTLLKMNAEHQIAVLEMGANHPGEIKFLCEIAKPDFGLITNIGKAHLEGFGSYEGVIRTKNEMYEYVDSNNGTIFYNSDNELLKDLLKNKTCRKIDYGTSDNAYCAGKIVSSDPYITFRVKGLPLIRSNLIGNYNFENLLAGVCLGKYFKVPPEQISEAVAGYTPDNNRSQVIQKASNEIILDAYNANPTSMKAAINNFSQLQRKNKALILGDMFELGEFSDEEHQNIISLVNRHSFSAVFYIGPVFRANAGSNHYTFHTTPDFIEWLKGNPLKNFTILIKGSRGMALEEIISYLE
ncbi:MAG: UDP-N-acetylmuramoyl-tripeptide--D-alanyl-D-alanine ligase [Bacteroidales bacterium]|nr:UDP-N-acetylmuramoyl-tripeptide--D-alanyl-D-alanine ligase [Bacteroidales bacterium]